MATFEASLNANIQATTRDLWRKTVLSQVFMKMPLLARLLLGRRIVWAGGKSITGPVQKAFMDDLAQSYTPNSKLTVQKKTLLENPYWHWKYLQLPITYDVQEFIENSGSSETAPVKLVKFLVNTAHESLRIKLYKMMYGIGTSGTDSDHDEEFQSVTEALTHDGTYGHLTRTIGSTINTWWQGASIAETFADQATSRTPSINTFRKALSACQIYDPGKPSDFMCVVGPSIFMELQSEVESRHHYQREGAGMMAKYGFNSIVIDGVEVVQDFYLRNSVWTDAHKKMYLVHVPDWEFRLHPSRSFKFTGFNWQGDKADGYDEWLARIMCAGNFICWRPNKSIYLSNVA